MYLFKWTLKRKVINWWNKQAQWRLWLWGANGAVGNSSTGQESSKTQLIHTCPVQLHSIWGENLENQPWRNTENTWFVIKISSCSKIWWKRNKKIIWKQEVCSTFWNLRRPQQPLSGACHRASVVKKPGSAAMDTEALRLSISFYCHFIFQRMHVVLAEMAGKKSSLILSSRSRRGDFFVVRKVLILSLNSTFGHWGLFPQQKLSFGFSSPVLHFKFWSRAKLQTASVAFSFPVVTDSVSRNKGSAGMPPTAEPLGAVWGAAPGPAFCMHM